MMSLYIYISSVFIAAIVSHMRLEGRVDTEVAKQINLKELLDVRLRSIDEVISTRLASIDQRLERIEGFAERRKD